MNQPTKEELKEMEAKFINNRVAEMTSTMSNMIIHKEYCSNKLNATQKTIDKFEDEYEINTKDLKIDLEIYKEMNRVYDNTIIKIKKEIEEAKNKKLPDLKVENLKEDVQKQT